jgi:probable phosphoglycerate mutase
VPAVVEPALFVIRHGATQWSREGRHTSRTDLALLPEGRARARSLAPVLARCQFSRVLCSPRLRARQTGELAGFGARLEVCEDLREWDYGVYEGLTSSEILGQRPGWSLWRDGCPGGESPSAVAARADRFLALVAKPEGDVLAFAHGHILRVVAARWCGLEVNAGEKLLLSPATVSKLGHEHQERVIETWNAAAS